MIAVPGDTPAETISAIIADEAAIGMVNNKTTAVRLLPAPGKTVGDRIEMGGLPVSYTHLDVYKRQDVDGVYTTDPRIVPSARKLDEITYDEMLELASQGAQVLHNRSVELAKKFRVNLEVVSSLERKPGTKVKEVTKVEKTNIAGVAKDTSIARVALIGLQHNPGAVSYTHLDVYKRQQDPHLQLPPGPGDGSPDRPDAVPDRRSPGRGTG